jgi:hypothetical protein
MSGPQTVSEAPSEVIGRAFDEAMDQGGGGYGDTQSNRQGNINIAPMNNGEPHQHIAHRGVDEIQGIADVGQPIE